MEKRNFRHFNDRYGRCKWASLWS